MFESLMEFVEKRDANEPGLISSDHFNFVDNSSIIDFEFSFRATFGRRNYRHYYFIRT